MKNGWISSERSAISVETAMTKLVIFDLDGTLLDTLDDLAAATNHALQANGLPPRSREEVRAFVGNGIPKLAARAVPEGTPPETEAAVLAELLAYYKIHCREKTGPYPGIPELLSALRDRGIGTAVVSNKADAAVQILCEAYFPGLYDRCVGEKPDVRRKPAPDSVNAVLAALDVSREAAVYVGDSDVDIQTAANAGLPCVSVTWGFRSRDFLEEHGARVFADSAEELKDLLLQMKG